MHAQCSHAHTHMFAWKRATAPLQPPKRSRTLFPGPARSGTVQQRCNVVANELQCSHAGSAISRALANRSTPQKASAGTKVGFVDTLASQEARTIATLRPGEGCRREGCELPGHARAHSPGLATCHGCASKRGCTRGSQRDLLPVRVLHLPVHAITGVLGGRFCCASLAPPRAPPPPRLVSVQVRTRTMRRRGGGLPTQKVCQHLYVNGRRAASDRPTLDRRPKQRPGAQRSWRAPTSLAPPTPSLPPKAVPVREGSCVCVCSRAEAASLLLL